MNVLVEPSIPFPAGKAPYSYSEDCAATAPSRGTRVSSVRGISEYKYQKASGLCQRARGRKEEANQLITLESP